VKIKNSEKTLNPLGVSLFIGRNANEVTTLFRAVIAKRISLGQRAEEHKIKGVRVIDLQLVDDVK
jgi:hypothetical protein